MKGDFSQVRAIHTRIHSPPKGENKLVRPSSSTHFPALSLPSYTRRLASSHILKRVNVSFMGSPKGYSALNLSTVNTAVGSHAASPRDEQSLGHIDGPISLLEAQLIEAKGRLRKGLALTLSTQSIRDALALRYKQELDKRKQFESSFTLPGKPIRLKAKKALSLDFKTPPSPSSPSNAPIPVLESFLAAGQKIPIRRKDTLRKAIRPMRLKPKAK